MTSCLDKLLPHKINNTAELVDDDDDMDDEMDVDDDDDDTPSSARQARRSSEERGEYSGGQNEGRSESSLGDDEVSKLLRRLADRSRTEVGSMDVVECIDEVLSSRRLRESDLEGMTSNELSILRNSIYARHGYRFTRDDLFNYFSNFSWYHPITSDMTAAYNSMSAIERYNIDFIRQHE
jgi:hypothetical protein